MQDWGRCHYDTRRPGEDSLFAAGLPAPGPELGTYQLSPPPRGLVPGNILQALHTVSNSRDLSTALRSRGHRYPQRTGEKPRLGGGRRPPPAGSRAHTPWPGPSSSGLSFQTGPPGTTDREELERLLKSQFLHLKTEKRRNGKTVSVFSLDCLSEQKFHSYLLSTPEETPRS